MHNTHPIGRVAVLMLITIVSIIVFSLIAVGICTALDIDLQEKTGLQLQSMFSQVGGFLLPALFFSVLYGRKSVVNFLIHKPKILHVILTILTAICALGIVAYTGELNQLLLEDQGGIFEALKKLEDESAEILKVLLTMESPSDLILNLFLVAVLPGVCEEFLFRGVLQTQLAKAFKNTHLAIWISAAIFSAIHFQFFGFIPRMLLGAFFGYLMVYGGSIWLAVLAHFLNNAAGVLGYYAAQHTDWITEEQVESTEVSVYLGLASLFLVFLFIRGIYRTSNWKEIKPEYERFPEYS